MPSAVPIKNQEKVSSAQKKHVRRKKQKEMEDQAIDETEVKNKQRDEFIQHAKQEYEDYQLEMMHDEVPVKPKTAEEAKKYEMKLEALLQRADELQGYVNQIQDAVTVGMMQLRDLKREAAGMSAELLPRPAT